MLLDFSQPNKKLRLDFRPRVYLAGGTHTYLWLRDGRAYGYFLTMVSGTIKIAKVDRLKDGGYRVYESAEVWWDLGTYEPYDFLKAVEKYHTSLLLRSDRAEHEMRKILGLPQLAAREPESDTPGDTPEKRRKAPRADKPATVKGYTLAELCEEIKMDPSVARKLLRGKVEKPGGKWEWPDQKATTAIRALLMQGQV